MVRRFLRRRSGGSETGSGSSSSGSDEDGTVEPAASPPVKDVSTDPGTSGEDIEQMAVGDGPRQRQGGVGSETGDSSGSTESDGGSAEEADSASFDPRPDSYDAARDVGSTREERAADRSRDVGGSTGDTPASSGPVQGGAGAAPSSDDGDTVGGSGPGGRAPTHDELMPGGQPDDLGRDPGDGGGGRTFAGPGGTTVTGGELMGGQDPNTGLEDNPQEEYHVGLEGSGPRPSRDDPDMSGLEDRDPDELPGGVASAVSDLESEVQEQFPGLDRSDYAIRRDGDSLTVEYDDAAAANSIADRVVEENPGVDRGDFAVERLDDGFAVEWGEHSGQSDAVDQLVGRVKNEFPGTGTEDFSVHKTGGGQLRVSVDEEYLEDYVEQQSDEQSDRYGGVYASTAGQAGERLLEDQLEESNPGVDIDVSRSRDGSFAVDVVDTPDTGQHPLGELGEDLSRAEAEREAREHVAAQVSDQFPNADLEAGEDFTTSVEQTDDGVAVTAELTDSGRKEIAKENAPLQDTPLEGVTEWGAGVNYEYEEFRRGLRSDLGEVTPDQIPVEDSAADRAIDWAGENFPPEDSVADRSVEWASENAPDMPTVEFPVEDSAADRAADWAGENVPDVTPDQVPVEDSVADRVADRKDGNGGVAEGVLAASAAAVAAPEPASSVSGAVVGGAVLAGLGAYSLAQNPDEETTDARAAASAQSDVEVDAPDELFRDELDSEDEMFPPEFRAEKDPLPEGITINPEEAQEGLFVEELEPSEADAQPSELKTPEQEVETIDGTLQTGGAAAIDGGTTTIQQEDEDSEEDDEDEFGSYDESEFADEELGEFAQEDRRGIDGPVQPAQPTIGGDYQPGNFEDTGTGGEFGGETSSRPKWLRQNRRDLAGIVSGGLLDGETADSQTGEFDATIEDPSVELGEAAETASAGESRGLSGVGAPTVSLNDSIGLSEGLENVGAGTLPDVTADATAQATAQANAPALSEAFANPTGFGGFNEFGGEFGNPEVDEFANEHPFNYEYGFETTPRRRPRADDDTAPFDLSLGDGGLGVGGSGSSGGVSTNWFDETVATSATEGTETFAPDESDADMFGLAPVDVDGEQARKEIDEAFEFFRG